MTRRRRPACGSTSPRHTPTLGVSGGRLRTVQRAELIVSAVAAAAAVETAKQEAVGMMVEALVLQVFRRYFVYYT